ncbi:MAG: FAD-dependent oxidoreductase [Candidatus Pararuminococcus gallinarum]|jgi:NADPH-dependent 2,4-dienoyl-CoA reductase/sulfur reductase-like enzyme/rhodanese-related sulfurtransferase
MSMKAVIVGGVAGGAGAAARLRRKDETAQIIMLEKGEYISFANCGLPYYVGDVITQREELLLQTPESFNARFQVDVRVNNEVLSVDTGKKTVTVLNHKTGETYTESYDKLILSPGASPIVPNMEIQHPEHVFTLRNIPDTFKIKDYLNSHNPRTAAVIGGGYIGLEMADNLCRLGLEVSVIEAASHVIASLDEDMSHELQNHLRSKGLDLHLGSMAQRIDRDQVILSDGREIPADMVILSIGVRPETGFLKDSGIALGSRGEILVDEYLQTNVPDVYAVGDAIGVKSFGTGAGAIIPLAGPANKQARIVADNLCGEKKAYHGTQGTAIAKVFDMTAAVTGENETTLRRAGIAYRKTFTISPSHAGYYPGGSTMVVKLLYTPEGKVLGAQIVGRDGVDKRMDVLASAIRAGMDVFDLQELELAYAPPFSSAKDPVNMAGYVAGNVVEGRMIPFYVEDLANLPENAFLLDVRTPGEFAHGTIPGAVNIPVDVLRQRLSEVPKDKEIHIFCAVGLRGYIAQCILRQNGYKTKNLSGGYRLYAAAKNDLAAQGVPMENCKPCGAPLE